MDHGIDAYFTELARFRRRLASLIVVVSLWALVLLLALRQPAIRELMPDPMRFGFEGQEQFVRRILLEDVGQRETVGMTTVRVITEKSQRGGSATRPVRTDPHGMPEPHHKIQGVGESDLDLLARAKLLRLDAPVIRSEDLVIEYLVRPTYPEEARDKDIEGVVELVALVDTTGAVNEVQIVGGSRVAMLEQSATLAVLQCRYKPYRIHDRAQKVYAAFRISFRLY